MTHWKTQFNYDYLGAYSLPDGKDIILTIRETKKEQVVGASGKKEECFGNASHDSVPSLLFPNKEECFVAYFFENVKPMILNRTNCKTLTKIFKNPNFESWINKQIQIGAVLVDAFGEKVDSLRIRPFLPKVENSLPTVETGSAIWKNILDGLAGGFTVAQVQTKYKLTKEQIKELVAHEIK